METETKITLGKLALYGVIPITWPNAIQEAVGLVGNRLRDRAAVRSQLLGDPDQNPGPDAAPSLFLREEYEIVPFSGRQTELGQLTDWALSRDQLVSVALITGGPGCGKSRLARRLCQIAYDEWDDPWAPGRLEAGNLKDPDHFKPLMSHPGPLLLVIDYAEQRADQVKALVMAALAASSRVHQVKLLLIARDEGEWWSNLDGVFANELDNPFEPSLVLRQRLGSIENDPTSDRNSEFQRAFGVFHETLDKGVPEKVPPIPSELTALESPEALDIHIAALLAAYGEKDGVAPNGSPEERLLQRFVQREQQSWDNAIVNIADVSGQGLEGKAIRRAIAWLGVTDDLEGADAAVERLRLLPEFADQKRLVLDGIAIIAAQMYPSDERPWWGGVRPDRLCSFLTRQFEPEEFAKTSIELPSNAQEVLQRHLFWHVQRYDDEKSNRSITALIDNGGASAILGAFAMGVEFGDPFGQLAAKRLGTLRVESADEYVSVAQAIYENTPQQTVALREVAAVATTILMNAAETAEEKGTLSNNLSIRLSELGRREAALAVGEEAVALYRELAQAGPDAFRHNLAMSLNNLCAHLSGLGRREAALAAGEEAVALYRELAQAGPDAFRHNLAMSLNNLSNNLSDLGQWEAALAVGEEAVALYRELAQAGADAFRPNLAMSLNNLSNNLSDLGRREAALAAVEEAVALYRELAQARPDAFRPDLAMSLNNLSNRLSILGRQEAALAAVEEAVTLYRELAQARPDAFRPDLAGSLNNLSNRLSELSRREAALAAVEEAVALCRELAQARPDAFRPDLAMSHGAMGRVKDATGDFGGAAACFLAGIEALREAFLALPGAHVRMMASLLRDYIESCQAREIEPDWETVAPVIEKLAEIGEISLKSAASEPE